MKNENVFRIDKLAVKIYPDRKTMGRSAAGEAAEKIRNLLTSQPEIRMIFAAAPSQNEFLETLISEDIPWHKITAFHMDEYIGLDDDAPQGFGNFLKERIFEKVPLKKYHLIKGSAPDISAECKRYTNLLNEAPIDIVCMGIGENGHIAFNDPPVADFKDPATVKVVELDEICRQQQVNDGCFEHIADVPGQALTLTVPALMSGKTLFCIVPAKTKAAAVKKTLLDPISESCPATILRQHDSAILYLDKDSSAMYHSTLI